VQKDEFGKVFKEAGETGLVTLKVGNEEKPVLIHNVQLDPTTEDILHIDFLQVDLKEKVTAKVPLEIVGESPAEKQGLGTAVTVKDEIEVEALPADLPEKFEIDSAILTEVDQAICVKDIKVDSSKVTVLDDPEDILVKVEPLRKEEVEAPPVVEAVPVEGEAPAAAEGETAGEGAPKEVDTQEEKKE
jgi:large subunit ribosomal protein L25